jgi:hypothetical protein
MTALATLRAKAAEKYKPYSIEFEDGTATLLQSILALGKDDLTAFNAGSKRLASLDDEEDLNALRDEFISLLSGVSEDKAATAAHLGNESLAVLTVIFEEYAGALSEGAKSAEPAGPAE